MGNMFGKEEEKMSMRTIKKEVEMVRLSSRILKISMLLSKIFWESQEMCLKFSYLWNKNSGRFTWTYGDLSNLEPKII